MAQHRVVLLVSIAIALTTVLSVPARAQPSGPPLPLKEATFTRWVFGRDGGIADDALACRATAGACVPGSRHLTFVAPVAVPAMASCASGATALMTCYAGAVERTQQALDQGSAWLLYEAAERMRVVANRANASATAPAWMKSASAANLLYRFFVDQGVPLSAPIGCTTGTETARYQCMGGTAGPTATVHRAAIGILDHHSDVLVNWGRTTGARTRLERIVRSAVAPAVSAMTTDHRLDPRLGPDLPRLDLLGKISYLRRLTGEAGSIEVERAYLEGLTAYQVSTTKPRVGAELALFAAARAARWTDPTTGNAQVVDAAIEADLVALLVDTEMAVQLQLVRGLVATAYDAAQVTTHYARARTAAPYDSLGLVQRYDDFSLEDFTTFSLGWTDGWDHCDWFTVEDITRSWTMYYPVTEDIMVKVPDCLPCLQGPGNPLGCDQECDPDTDWHWESIGTTTTWVAGPTTTVKIGENVIADSIRFNYKLLLDADDGDWVDVDNNGAPDLDLDADGASTNPTIARSGISATECLAELATISGGYDHALDASSLDCDVGAANCKGQYGGSDGHMFLPYAMAARLCPMYVKQAVGVDAVTLVNGEISSIAKDCPTPLEFVATVANTLEDADSKYLDALEDAFSTPIGEMLGYFAAEANLLTTPVAGTLRQRADLAYFSAEPLGDCGDTPTGDCVGLEVLEARLALAEDPLLKGLALYRQFSRIDRDDVGFDGDHAIATFADDSVGVCAAPGDCLSNSTDQLHALTYRRLRDALGVYQSTRTDQVEVLWRRLDAMPATCVAPIDTDGDGALDTNACVATDPACSEFCPHYDAVHALVEDTTADMASVVTDLGEQLAILDNVGTSNDLASLIGDVGAWAGGIADGVTADVQAIDSGVDWLGDRKGRWAVVSAASGSTLTEEIEAELAMLEVDADAVAADYDGWIAGYLDDLSVESAFAQTATEVGLSTQSNIASYCQDLAGNAAPGGCGVGVALDDHNPTADRINDILVDQFCKVAVAEFSTITVNLANPNSAYYLPAGDPYLDWIAEAGLTDCPRLVTPDVAALTASYGGSLITTNVLGMERALLDLEAAITDFHAYIQYMNQADALFATYEDAVDSYQKKKATREWLLDSVVCGAALIGATAATIGSYGAGAVTFVGAGATCVDRFATGAGNLFPNDGNYTAEELSFEASYINQQVQQAEQLYSATMKLETVLLRVADYQAAVLVYRSELAAFQRTVAFGNTALDALGTYQVFADPVYLAFEQQELANLKSSFKDFAGRIQDARRTVEYDIGNIVPVGAAYQRTVSESYWMPRLADITIASSAGADSPSAYTSLTMTGAAPPPAENQTLVAAASLLLKLYADFREVYGERLDNGETAYVGSPNAGLVDADNDGMQDVVDGELVYGNSGELAMLGDSRFYAHDGKTASGCEVGWVDVADYCQVFSNDAVVLPVAGNCADISTKSASERLGLAHLDRMLRTPGVETFNCTIDAVDGSFHIAARAGSAVGGAFTGGVSGDLPFYTNQAPWHREVTGVVDEIFYAAQTATVRALIDAYLDGVLDERYELSKNFRFYPGTYLYHIDMTDPWLEPEHDVLTGAPFAPQTMSEQIDAVAVICTSVGACGADSYAVEDSKPIDVAMFGPGYKGTRCQYGYDPVVLLDGTVSTFAEQSDLVYVDGSSRQAQLQYEMDHDLSAGTVHSIKTTAPESQPLIETVLDETSGLQRPLHVSGMLVGVYGLYDANPVNGAADNTNIWSLHLGGNEPHLRLAVRYSHYNTDPIAGAEAIDINNFLACPPDSERM